MRMITDNLWISSDSKKSKIKKHGSRSGERNLRILYIVEVAGKRQPNEVLLMGMEREGGQSS